MPRSEYVESIRSRIGHDLLLLPGVTAVIREGERFLLARHEHSGLWSLIGGAVEPGEEPGDAVLREVLEETGARIRVTGIVGVYGGEPMMVEYPNGDRVGYVTTAYECELLSAAEPDGKELLEIGWFERPQIGSLPRRTWIDRVIADAPRPRGASNPPGESDADRHGSRRSLPNRARMSDSERPARRLTHTGQEHSNSGGGDPRMKQRMNAVGAMLLVVGALSLSGCAPAAAPLVSASPVSAAKATNVNEAFFGATIDFDPYDSPQELAAGADLIIEGTVEVFQDGRELLVADGSETPSGETVVLVVSEPKLVGGDTEDLSADLVYVELMASAADGIAGLNRDIPRGTPVLVYAERAYTGTDPLGDEVLKDPDAGRPAGEDLFRLHNPQSLVFQAGDDLVWPMIGAVMPGLTLADAYPDGTVIAK